MVSTVSKRLMKEFTNLTTTPPDGVTVTSDNPGATWSVFLKGPSDTPYEGGTFIVKIEFPDNYPFKPPKAKFITKIYHPSIKQDSGEICQDIYEKDWVPTKTMEGVIDILKTMLVAPNTETPLEAEIGNEFVKDRPKFNEKAKEYTKKYAMDS
mmetsp:Transcript_76908/g.89360  ORF Transcript_76908/g.89360 Transcript_76908/m.89360 type:complete len:153 (-) Transcript_76908:214-672(-)|eukprot:CAMPEP_0176440228 /NCGR_PEP_ID=MMETSP0127-20121128/20438_1 /TAXON_ID=938130 /ORGANISM="Platyophrya macrostoma, Strain WH" /LENGTH=152 /DNA_ID=CAMNT_0017824697 /DNA_START=36 /DNA_END=494 /DNA_ORIENTATION=+